MHGHEIDMLRVFIFDGIGNNRDLGQCLLNSRFFFALCCALATAACGDRNRPVDTSTDDQVLLVGNGVEPRTLDPQLNLGSPDGRIISAISEGLVTQDPKDPFGAQPGVAERWSHDEDFRVWTFHLRSDARWSDGSALTAQDFLYSWRRILSPALGAALAELFYQVEGAEAFNKGETGDFGRVGIKAPDRNTLVITGSAPMPYLLNMLSTYPFYPVQKAAVEAGGAMTDRSNTWFEPGKYVGNGPFILAEWRTNQFVEVRKNPHYWDAGNVRLNSIRFFAIENQKSELNAFLSGRVHMTSSLPVEQIARLRKEFPDALRIDRQPGSSFYAVNTKRGVLADRRVRQALSLAIDRKLLTDRVLLGGQQPLGGIVPAGLPGYISAPVSPPDPAKARQLLAAAGYPGGKDFPDLEILINTAETNRKQAEAIQAMWKSVLGIDVAIRNQEWKVFLNSVQTGDYDISRASWTGAYPGPGAYLSMMTGTSPTNSTGWSDERYDRLVKQALATGDPGMRNRLFGKAEKILIGEAAIIPLFSGTQTTLVDPRVKGWGRNGAQNYKFVEIGAK